MAGEKTEKATPKRRKDERKKGSVFQSKEVTVVASLAALFFSFKLLAPMILSTVEESIRRYITMIAEVETLGAGSLRRIFVDACITFAIASVPLMLISCAVGVACTLAQTRGLFSSKGFAFKISHINPLKGLKRIVSLRGIVELVKAIFKIVLLSVVLYLVLKDQLALLPRMMDMELIQSMAMTGSIIMEIVWRSIIVFAFVAAVDFIYQWWDYEKNIRMSKQEIKEEYKQTEGDPQIKGKIRDKQMQAARRRMMQAVPGADVVVRNPTHYAVALRYKPEKDAAPIVVAKGMDDLALRIVAAAQKSGVTVTENRPLARGLYESVDLEHPIPESFYQAVAEVLAFVYGLKQKQGNNGL